jgi:hypothetical protein
MCHATYRTWILPSSHRLGILHLIIHVKYVRVQKMLIRCYFAIIIMVATIYFSSSRSSLKFPPTFGIVHHVLLNTLISIQTMPHFFWLGFWGDTWEFHFNLLLYIIYIYIYIYICACIYFWLISFYLWLVLVYFSIKFTMDLHSYDTKCNDSCHADMHGFIHNNWLKACQSCL